MGVRKEAMRWCIAKLTGPKSKSRSLTSKGKLDAAGNVVADRWAKEGASRDRGFGRELALQTEMAKGGASSLHDLGKACLG